MADVQAIIDAAVTRSASAQPDMLTVDAPELVRIVSRALSNLYLLAARRRSVNFGATATAVLTAGSPSGWPYPADALSVLRVEALASVTVSALAEGTEIAVTRLDDQQGMAPMPSVYEFARRLVSCGGADDPVNQDLRIFYAAAAPPLTDTADPLPDALPEQFYPLLELPLAIYIARKEGRADDLAVFQEELATESAYFDAWLTDASIAQGDRFAGLRPEQVSAAADDGE